MRRRIALFLIATCAAVVFADSPTFKPTPTAATQRAGFPTSWFGHWKGESELVNGSGVVQRFQTELKIGPGRAADTYEWTIIYDGAMGRQERPYRLIVQDAAEGRYAIDEGQGIVLPATLLGDVLASSFEVMGNRIDATYHFRPGAHGRPSIELTLVTKKTDSEVTTGGKDGVPEVKGWTPTLLQHATLRPVE